MRPYRRAMRRELRDLIEESGANGYYSMCIDDLRVKAFFTSVDAAMTFMRHVALINRWIRYRSVRAKLQSLTLNAPQEGQWVSLTIKFDPDYLKSLYPAGADG